MTVPLGWASSTLGEIAEFVRGITFPASAKLEGPTDRSASCLRTSNVQQELEFDDLLFVPVEYVKREDQWLAPGDIVISMANSYELVGKVAFAAHAPPRTTFGGFLSAIRPKGGVQPRYLYFVLRGSAMQDLIRRTSSRTVNIANLSVRKLEALPVSIPPANEQRRIVAKLETLLARSGRAKEALDSIPARLERFRQSVLAAAFRGDLTRDWREANPHVEPASKLLERIRAERRRRWEEAELERMLTKGKAPTDDKWKGKYEEPVEPSELPFAVPDGWSWTSWDVLSDWVTYGFTRPMPHVGDGPIIITAKNVAAGRIDFANAHRTTEDAFAALSEKDRPRAGDILVTKDGTIGRAAVVPAGMTFCISQSVAVIWLRESPMSRGYLLRAIEAPFTQRPIAEQARGNAVQHLSITDFAALPVPVPPLLEQLEIERRVEASLAALDKVAKITDQSLTRLGQLEQGLLTKAFLGELVAQDPADEPASALLQRIRAEQDKPASNEPGPRPKRRRETQVA